MVQAVALLLPASLGGAISVGGIALTSATGALTLAGSLVNLAGSALINYALRPEAPEPPRPADIQINSKVSNGARFVCIGRAKLGGNTVYHRGGGGVSHRVIVHAHGGLSEIEDYFLLNRVVDVWQTGDPIPPWNPGNLAPGYVADGQYSSDEQLRVRIFSRLGDVPSDPYDDLTVIYPEWTEDHRLDGQATSWIMCRQVKASQMNRVYPRGEPDLMVIGKAREIYDPRSDSTAWTENAALWIAHYIASPDGLNRPGLIDAETLSAQADICDQDRALTAGGTEKRWRFGGVWSLTERPQDVLRRMLDACAGRMLMRPDGKYDLIVGQALTASVTLRFSDLIEIQEIVPGPDKIDRYNILPAQYVDQSLDFVQVDAEAWEDTARQAVDGDEVAPVLNLQLCPSHRQTRAAMRQRMAWDNPAWRFKMLCKPRALPALSEPEILLDMPEIGIEGQFEVRGHEKRFDPRSGLLEAVVLDLVSVDPDASDISLAQEGLPQLPTSGNTGAQGIPVPQNVTAEAQGVQVSGAGFAAGIAVSWDAVGGGSLWAGVALDVLRPAVQYADAAVSPREWREFPVEETANGVTISPLVDGGVYDLRVAFETVEGARGEFATVTGITARADPDAPLAPTGLAVADLGNGVARVTVTASATESNWKTRILRDGVQVAEIASAPGAVVTFDDASGAGSFDWTAVAVNVSGIVSTAVGPVSQTVTVAAAASIPDETAVTLTGGLGTVALQYVNPDSNAAQLVVYRTAVGDTFDAGTDEVARIATPRNTLVTAYDGDPTRVTILADPDLDDQDAWDEGSNWTIAGGEATRASGFVDSLSQTVSLTTGVTYRGRADVSSWTSGSGQVRLVGGTTVNGPVIDAAGIYDFELTAATGNFAFRIVALSTDFVTSVTRLVLFPETAACVPQGDHEYRFAAVNAAGVVTVASDPVTVTVI